MSKADRTDWERVNAMTDEDVERVAREDPDAQPWTEEELRSAKRVTLADLGIAPPKRKAAVSLRVDADVLDWFRKQGKGYQTLMTSVLKAYKEAASTSKSPAEAAEKLSSCLRQG